MSALELFLVAVGLSMDAFAVAVAKGMGAARLNMRNAFVIGLFFGGFQMLMPLVGWVLGAQLADAIAPIDHWVAFVLLVAIGGKMIIDAMRGKGDCAERDPDADALDMRELVLLAIATSIDALAIGVTFAFLEVDIVSAAAFIGIVTFALSMGGVAVGHQFGARWNTPSSIAGGVALMLIGAHILLNHLGIIPF